MRSSAGTMASSSPFSSAAKTTTGCPSLVNGAMTRLARPQCVRLNACALPARSTATGAPRGSSPQNLPPTNTRCRSSSNTMRDAAKMVMHLVIALRLFWTVCVSACDEWFSDPPCAPPRSGVPRLPPPPTPDDEEPPSDAITTAPPRPVGEGRLLAMAPPVCGDPRPRPRPCSCDVDASLPVCLSTRGARGSDRRPPPRVRARYSLCEARQPSDETLSTRNGRMMESQISFGSLRSTRAAVASQPRARRDERAPLRTISRGIEADPDDR